MTRPGFEATISDQPPARFPAGDTATAFVVGVTEKGPVDAPALVRSLASFEVSHGSRQSWATNVYDWLDAFFNEGGSRAYVLRAVGPAAEASAASITGAAAAPSLAIEAINPGAWGDDLDVVVSAGVATGTYRISIQIDGADLEASPDLTTPADAVAWAQGSAYVKISAAGTAAPSVGTYSLTGGDDDRAAVGDAEIQAALDGATEDYGPGQVAAPGRTTLAAREQLLQHAADQNRRALVDSPNGSTVSQLVADAAALRAAAGDNCRYGAQFSPWAVVPGVAAGTTREVPYSAIEAGLIARSEAAGNDPNVPAAGANGRASYANDLAQDAFTDAELESLNGAGVNAARVIRGEVRTYDYRTLVNPVNDPRWVEFSGSRQVMDILAEARVIGENYVLAQIDGKGLKLADYGADLTAICSQHYQNGALYGETADEAYRVDVGPDVNTPESIANRELRARLSLRTSPYAERVEIEVTRRQVTENV